MYSVSGCGGTLTRPTGVRRRRHRHLHRTVKRCTTDGRQRYLRRRGQPFSAAPLVHGDLVGGEYGYDKGRFKTDERRRPRHRHGAHVRQRDRFISGYPCGRPVGGGDYAHYLFKTWAKLQPKLFFSGFRPLLRTRIILNLQFTILKIRKNPSTSNR